MNSILKITAKLLVCTLDFIVQIFHAFIFQNHKLPFKKKSAAILDNFPLEKEREKSQQIFLFQWLLTT